MEAGRVIGSKYELVRLLGRGSMGQVWIAHHLTLGEEVALKLLAAPPPLGGEPENASNSAARFRFEAQVAARLSRKTRHIVRVTDHGEEENGLAYLVMELLEGQTLEELLMQRGAMEPLEVAKLVNQMARALEQAHAESIIHRDLKPANVFVTCDEDGGMLVKLLDFGIARAIRAQRVISAFSTGEGLIFGTPGYMSPEQACASKLDARCDLWALATVAYEALTGQLPVGGTCTEELLKNLQAGRLVPVHERNPGAPTGLSAFFERAFARQIDERFGSASQLALAFEQAASSQAVAPPTRTIPLPIPVPPVRQPVRGDTLLAVRAPRRPLPASRKWGRLAFVAPATMLGLAMAVVAWRVPASSPPAEGAASAARSERGSLRPPSADPAASVAFVPSTLVTADEGLVPDAPAPHSGVKPREPQADATPPPAKMSPPPMAAALPSARAALPLPVASVPAPRGALPPPLPAASSSSSAGLSPPSPPRRSVDKSAVL